MVKMASKQTDSSKIIPLFDNVLIKPEEAEVKTTTGIYLPDSAKEKPQKGTVMAIGPGMADANGKTIPMQVKKGQKVMYKSWGTDSIKVNGEEWVVIEQKNILVVVE